MKFKSGHCVKCLIYVFDNPEIKHLSVDEVQKYLSPIKTEKRLVIKAALLIIFQVYQNLSRNIFYKIRDNF